MRESKCFLLQQMKLYLDMIPDAAPEEIAELKTWVDEGNSPFGNPYHVADESGTEMPFIHALRIKQSLCETEASG